MSDRTFDQLEWQLTKERIRCLGASLGKPDPEFHDEDPPRPVAPSLSPASMRGSRHREGRTPPTASILALSKPGAIRDHPTKARFRSIDH